MRKFTLALLVVSMFGLSACGTTNQDRALGGAALGAGVGAGIGLLLGGIGIGAGALLGAGVGALGGYVIDPSDVNLGEPVWK